MKEAANWIRPGLKIRFYATRCEWIVVGRCPASDDWALERVGKWPPSKRRRTLSQDRADRYWVESTNRGTP